MIHKSIHNVGRDSSSRNIIYVGRILLEGQKNLKMLIDSLSICKIKYMLHIIGSGDDEDALMEYAKSLNIHDQILIHGYKIDPWLYIKNEIKTVNALVLPSKREGFGLVLVEALSNGLPCIATSCLSGPSDIIIDGKNGYLVPTDSINEFATKLELLLNAKFDCSVGLNRFSHENYYYSFMNAISKALR